MRSVRIHDLPFIYRMSAQGISFDMQLQLTVGHGSISQAVLKGMGRTQAYVLRDDGQHGLGVLHFPPGDQHARLAYLAPALEQGEDEGLWLSLLDGLTAQAGEHGAINLIAEANEDGPAAAVLKRACFATYTRQEIWGRMPAPIDAPELSLRQAGDVDQPAVLSLHGQLVPALLKHAEPPPTSASVCYLVEGGYHLEGLLPVYRGPRAALIEAYLLPEVYDEAEKIFTAVLNNVQAASRPVYCRIRHYSAPLDGVLTKLGFERLYSQVVMIRHTAARIEQPELAKMPTVENGIVIRTPFAEYTELEFDR